MPTTHPAQYTNSLIPIFAGYLKGTRTVLDPMAGTGKLGKIKKYGYLGEIYLNEIEPEWAEQCKQFTEHVTACDARYLPYIDEYFDAICTSPVYGNRMSDHHNAKDGSRRITYTHMLGRKLTEGNTGVLHWGEKYRKAHVEIWTECLRVLRPGGLFILNVSDHIRKGEVQPVTVWHIETLMEMGLKLQVHIPVQTPRMGFGANRHLRVDHEHVCVFTKRG